MFEGSYFLWQMLPLSLLLFFFVGGLLLRLKTDAAKPFRDYSYVPTVSVLLPVFHEGANVRKTIDSIFAADYPKDKLQVIAVDDCSTDDSYAHVLAAQKDYPGRLLVGRNEVNSGKHMTLTHAFAQSNGEVVICIDSDCIFKEDVVRELVACLADPEVGAVGGNVGVTNVNKNIFTRAQTLIYAATFQIGKMAQTLQGKVFCISGCLFAVRRHIFESVEKDVVNRNWYGLKVRDGEDRFMTHMILLRGWKTKLNPNAVCWTAVPETFKSLFTQQVRWRRSCMRDLFWILTSIPTHLKVMPLTALMTVLIPEVIIMLWSMFLLTLIPTVGLGHSLLSIGMAFFMMAAMFTFNALGYNYFMPRLAPGTQKIQQPVLVALAGAWFLMDSLIITPIALLTFNIGAWGNREAGAPPMQKPEKTDAPIAEVSPK